MGPPFQGQADPNKPATLGDLRAHLSQITGIPYKEIKLVYHGLILKDDSLSLQAYNIRSDAKVMLVGTSGGAGVGDRPGDKVSRHANDDGLGQGGRGAGSSQGSDAPRSLTKGELLAEERRRKEADRSEVGVTARIDEVMQNISAELEPQLRGFEQTTGATSSSSSKTTTATIPTPSASSEEAASAAAHSSTQAQKSSGTTTAAASPAPTPTAAPAASTSTAPAASPQRSLVQTHRYLNELLSRSLLQLDAIPAVSETTRKHRKEAVKLVQDLIDRLDAAWEKVPAAERRKEQL